MAIDMETVIAADIYIDDATPTGLSIIPDEDITAYLHDLTNNNHGKTLLPSPIAKAVSLATRSTSLALRMGTIIGGYGFDAAKITTLSSLELGRVVLEGILGRAGRDVISRSGSDLGKADAETILERSLENLHRTMTQIVFWTATGFHMTGTTMAMVSESSQLLLSTLDQFFGSTDSSRAMASIITLIRREFQNPATGILGEKVGVADLMLGFCGLAYLQKWSRRLIEEENRKLRVEETVWDVVVLSNGVRVDVHEEGLYGVHDGYGPEENSGGGLAAVKANEKLLATIEDHGAQDSEDDRDSLPEMRLKHQIMRSLPENAHVSITTRSSTTKTITVDITGGMEDLPFSPPPGVELIEESKEQVSSRAEALGDSHIPPTCRVVYRLHRNKERRTSFKKEDGDISQVTGYVEEVDDESQAGSTTEVDDRPPVPRKNSLVKTPVRRPSSAASAASSSSTRSAKPSRIPSPTISRKSIENTANQKRPRVPPSAAVNNRSAVGSRRQSINRFLSGTKEDAESGSKQAPERKTGFRSVLRRQTGLFNRDDSGFDSSQTKRKGKRIAGGPPTPASPVRIQPRHSSSPTSLLVPGRRSSLIPRQTARAPPGRAGINHGARPASRDVDEPFTRSSSRASYISVHEIRRDSMISQTDTYSITTTDDYRPVSPTAVPTDAISESPLSAKPRLERESTGGSFDGKCRRVKSHLHSPSIYTLRAIESYTTLVPFYQRSAFNNNEALGTLRRAGMVDGMFPRCHLLRNITRYMRFASASYGSSFLKLMGIAKGMPILRVLDDTHHELRSFAHHTGSDANSILLSSFVDPQGGSDGTGSTNTGVPLVHYISLDHESKAVVLACRGTLGFEDVLADMTCDYDDLIWRGNSYKVHKGIHASARRLLYGGDGRVLYTLKQALEEFPDYGLVLTGHSLGGAVTALLGVMLSEPAEGESTFFITSPQPHTRLLLGDGNHTSTSPEICLPSGRPVHVFAYGPPSTMSASLCHATRGLITSIINGNDLVPYLSLGVLHDFQAVALAFKTDNNEAKVEVRQRIWDALQTGLADKWYGSRSSSSERSPSDDEQWAYAALKVLRASMMSQKLLPPGEVFVVESTRVLRRDAFMREGEPGGEEHFGRPAQRIVLKYIRDVEKRFREVRFGTSMLTDHSPGKYEDALNKLKMGVMDAA
ncbi:lipase [Immersiella caudata]|uniref:sn-1-specific diacylglycerol lipase n=1 Tax=Immersiella caudata TaxID=314043 RepID=A0AA39XGU2_9PEZI|nr:lipase [Immersiella caudata]